jgi:hypothetical protein
LNWLLPKRVNLQGLLAADNETGCIVRTGADVGANGRGSFSSRDDHSPKKKTQAFKTEFAPYVRGRKISLQTPMHSVPTDCST